MRVLVIRLLALISDELGAGEASTTFSDISRNLAAGFCSTLNELGSLDDSLDRLLPMPSAKN